MPWEHGWVRKPRQRDAPAALITAAEPSQAEQLQARQKRYLIMMGTRVLCLVGAASAYGLRLMWLVPIFVVGLVALPWMAVLIANDRPPLKPSRFRRAAVPPVPERAIEATRGNVIDQ